MKIFIIVILIALYICAVIRFIRKIKRGEG